MRAASGKDGFTLIEVVIAVFMISVGILALLEAAGASAVMLRDGRLRTRASAVAASRIDSLRVVAASTNPTCTALTSGSASHVNGISESWTVTGSGRSRTVTELVAVSNGPRQIGQMSFQGSIYCP